LRSFNNLMSLKFSVSIRAGFMEKFIQRSRFYIRKFWFQFGSKEVKSLNNPQEKPLQESIEIAENLPMEEVNYTRRQCSARGIRVEDSV
jgi:hypothetical protein